MASSTVASLRLLLGLDPGGVHTGASQVTGDLKGIQLQAETTNATLAQIGRGLQFGVGLGAGFAAFTIASRAAQEFTSFIGESVTAAKNLEAAEAGLNASLAANVPAFNGNKDAIEAATSAGERLGFTNLDLLASYTRIVAATHDVATAVQVQAVALDLARFKSISLQDATDSLINIEGGRYRALAALGIVLEKGTTQTEALAAVEKVAGGQAEAFAATSAGAFARLDVAVESLKEHVGAPLADAFAHLAGGVVDATTALGGYNAAVDYANAHQLKPPPDQGIPRIPLLADAIDALTGTMRQNDTVVAQMIVHSQVAAVTTEQQAAAARDLADAQFKAAAGTDESGRSAQLATAAASGLTTVTDQASAAQLRVAQATVDAKTAHDDLANAEKAAETATGDNTGAVNALAVAQAADKAATDALKTAQDDLAASLKPIPSLMLGAGNGTDTYTDALLRNANAAAIAKAALDALPGVPFTGPPPTRDPLSGDILPPGGETAGDSYLKRQQIALQNQRDAQARADKAAADAAAQAKKDAAAFAAEMHDKLNKAFDDMATAAHDAYAKVHEDTLKAIDDARNQADAQINEQERAIRANLTAEQQRVAAMRAHQQELTLQANLATAVTGGDPAQIAAAQLALNTFLDDQRLAFLSSQADTQIASLEAQKANNDAKAALATAAENARNKAAVKALDEDLSNLKDHLKKYTAAWAGAFAEIEASAKAHHVSGIAGSFPASVVAASQATSPIAPPVISPSAAVAAGLAAPATLVINNTFQVDGSTLLDIVERHQFNLQGIYSPIVPSTGSQR